MNRKYKQQWHTPKQQIISITDFVQDQNPKRKMREHWRTKLGKVCCPGKKAASSQTQRRGFKGTHYEKTKSYKGSDR